MSERRYDRLANVFMLVAIGSALLFDSKSPWHWVVGVLGIAAGVAAVALYFANQSHGPAIPDSKESGEKEHTSPQMQPMTLSENWAAGLGADLEQYALYAYVREMRESSKALIVAALLMVSIGVSGVSGVAAVLGVAAVVCVSSAVAGEMLQDLKVGHILGGTPKLMQIGDILGIVVASAVMYFPLLWLHMANIKSGGIGFGDPKLSAPQAGLMAAVAQGIVGGHMAWPLVIVGIFMGLALIMLQVKSPMLFAVGM